MKILTLTGVSGTGKTTVCKELIENHDCTFLVSITTREKRDSDLEGEFEYLSEEDFLKEKAADKFLWTSYHYGNWYGTRKADIINALYSDTISLMILVPDVVPILHQYAGDDVLSLFMEDLPQETLRKRMEERGDKEEIITKRLQAIGDWHQQALQTEHYSFISSEGEVKEIIGRILSKF